MEKNAKYFREAAWAQLTGNWKSAVLVTLVYILIVGAMEGAKSLSFLSIFVLGPLSYGYYVSFLNSKRTGEVVRIENLFDGFKDYARVFLTNLLQSIYIVLWTLLLIVPGIIKSISYSQTFFVLKDNPELKNNAAIERSMAMMEGHKMEYFCLILSFIGWLLLGILTLGIGLLWVNPYICVTNAHFYEYVKEEYEKRLTA
jgi:uncharacterized membrane protein